MAEFKDRLREAMNNAGLNQSELAQKAGITQSSVSDWLKGKYLAKQDKVDLLAKALGVSPSWLMGMDLRKNDNYLPSNIVPLEKRQIPILGSVACGKPIFDPSDGVQIKVPSSFHADFGLYARGDSMIGADIHDGDLVFFVQQPSVENGQIAAVFIDDEVTLKRVYYQQGERLVLQAENSSVPPIIIEGPDLNQVHIIGRAIAKQSAVV